MAGISPGRAGPGANGTTRSSAPPSLPAAPAPAQPPAHGRTLGQDYLPGRVGTAGGVTLGLAVSVGGVFAPALGALADATSPQTMLVLPAVFPAVAWLLTHRLLGGW